MGREAVAQIIHRYGGGGAQRVTLTLARGLRRAGLESCAISMIDSGEYVEGLGDDVTIVDLKTGRGGLLGALIGCFRLRKFLLEHPMDLVHSHNRGSLIAFLLATLGWREKPRLWFTWHIPDQVLAERGIRRWILIRALRRCERIWGDAQDIIDRIVEQVPDLADRSRPFINAVPEREITPAQESEQPVLLWMARIARTKDPEIFLRATARLRDEGLVFRAIVAGSAIEAHQPYEEAMRKLHGELHLEGVVELRGWVDDIDALLNEVNIGVQTSHHEGLSLTLLEQMMAGLAPVASDVGDTRLAVSSGETGILIPPRNFDALCAALRLVIQSVEERRKLGASAHDIAMREFSMTAMTNRTIEFIRAGAAPAPAG